jgi:hypothetical protein
MAPTFAVIVTIKIRAGGKAFGLPCVDCKNPVKAWRYADYFGFPS